MAKFRSLFTRSSSKNKKTPAPVKLPARLGRIPSSPPPPYQKETAYIADQLHDDSVAPTAEPEPTVPRRKHIRTILKKCVQPFIRFSKTKVGRGLVSTGIILGRAVLLVGAVIGMSLLFFGFCFMRLFSCIACILYPPAFEKDGALRRLNVFLED